MPTMETWETSSLMLENMGMDVSHVWMGAMRGILVPDEYHRRLDRRKARSQKIGLKLVWLYHLNIELGA
jgi:hypothetical protein